jgi:hypothetical protein
MVMWIVEMFLDAISVKYLTIPATMTDGARRDAFERFTSADSDCNLLLIHISVGGAP